MAFPVAGFTNKPRGVRISKSIPTTTFGLILFTFTLSLTLPAAERHKYETLARSKTLQQDDGGDCHGRRQARPSRQGLCRSDLPSPPSKHVFSAASRAGASGDSEYDPEQVWTKGSVAELRTMITALWLLTFVGLAIYLTTFILFQRRR
jgi:hypothetical protein